MSGVELLRRLSALDLPGVFNPYVSKCDHADTNRSPALRRANLLQYVELCCGKSKEVWFGRDLGYCGGRRTGLAFTDDFQIANACRLFGTDKIRRATVGPMVRERTATTVWEQLNVLELRPFLWNVFPLHPFEPGNPFSNRAHRRAEFDKCVPITMLVMDLINPTKVVAVGKDAYRELLSIGISCNYVRHPSFGGKADFIRGLRTMIGE